MTLRSMSPGSITKKDIKNSLSSRGQEKTIEDINSAINSYQKEELSKFDESASYSWVKFSHDVLAVVIAVVVGLIFALMASEGPKEDLMNGWIYAGPGVPGVIVLLGVIYNRIDEPKSMRRKKEARTKTLSVEVSNMRKKLRGMVDDAQRDLKREEEQRKKKEAEAKAEAERKAAEVKAEAERQEKERQRQKRKADHKAQYKEKLRKERRGESLD